MTGGKVPKVDWRVEEQESTVESCRIRIENRKGKATAALLCFDSRLMITRNYETKPSKYPRTTLERSRNS